MTRNTVATSRRATRRENDAYYTDRLLTEVLLNEVLIKVSKQGMLPLSAMSGDWTDIYVGRPSDLGNPYHMNDESDRSSVCQQYQEYFDGEVQIPHSPVRLKCDRLLSLIKAGNNIRLVCWCYPKQCHADTIRNWLEGQLCSE